MSNEPTTPSAAPTPDAHKCGYICNHCKQHFPGYAQYWWHKCKTATLTESSDAPTPETNEEAFGTGRVSVDFARRLERERDEARKELKERNKSDYCCKECGSFGPFEGIVYPDTPNGPAEYDMKCEECGSLDICENAREVVMHWMETAGDLKGELEDARAALNVERMEAYKESKRADEAEQAAKYWENDSAHWSAQLAAAQAEARELREALERIDKCGDSTEHAIARAALAKKEGER